jgi:hypothetical protein
LSGEDVTEETTEEGESKPADDEEPADDGEKEA